MKKDNVGHYTVKVNKKNICLDYLERGDSDKTSEVLDKEQKLDHNSLQVSSISNNESFSRTEVLMKLNKEVILSEEEPKVSEEGISTQMQIPHVKPQSMILHYLVLSLLAFMVTCSVDCNPIMSSCANTPLPLSQNNPLKPNRPTGMNGGPHPTNDCSLTQSGTGLVNLCPPSKMSGQTYQAVPYTQQPGPVTNCTVNCKTVIKKNGNAPLSTLENMSPDLAREIQKILTYSGIKEPWDRLKDFFDDKQRMMPDPCMLYTQMRDILKIFDSLKEVISDELRKVQLYVERAKSYLKEDHFKLNDQLSKMKNVLNHLRKTNDDTLKSDYANTFNKINEETQTQIGEYKKLKEWLFDTLTAFKRLF